MLELTGLVVRRPDGRMVIGGADLALEPGTVNLLAGANGVGSSTLCRAVTGRLERGWRVSGRVDWRPTPGGRRVSLLGLGATELAGVVGCALSDPLEHALRTRAAGEQTVRGLVSAQAAVRSSRAAASAAARQAIEALGLAGTADEPGWTLSRAQRWVLALAQALAGRPALLVLDGVLGQLADTAASGLLGAVRQLADQGTTVIWAEHLYEQVAEIADTVIELQPMRTPGARALVSPADSWRPQGQTAPELMQLVRGLGLDEALWRDPVRLNEELRALGRPTVMATRRTVRDRAGAEPAHPPLEVPLVALGIGSVGTSSPTAGEDAGDDALTVSAGERVGVICHDPGQARTLVSRLAAALGAPPVGQAEALLAREGLDAAFADWDREHPAARPTAEVFGELLGPGVQLPQGTLRAGQLSGGQRMAARLAMLLGGGGPAVLTDPVAAFDPQMRGRLAARLAGDDSRARAVVIVGTSPELLVRLCDRIVEIDGDTLLQDAGPMLAQRRPRCRTRLSTACAPLVVTDVEQALALLRGPAPNGAAR